MILTNSPWNYINKSNVVIEKTGTWLHLPEDEMVDLLMYIENLEEH